MNQLSDAGDVVAFFALRPVLTVLLMWLSNAGV